MYMYITKPNNNYIEIFLVDVIRELVCIRENKPTKIWSENKACHIFVKTSRSQCLQKCQRIRYYYRYL